MREKPKKVVPFLFFLRTLEPWSNRLLLEPGPLLCPSSLLSLCPNVPGQIYFAFRTVHRWLLARRPDNRLALGRLWAIDGLLHALRSNARLDVKEG